MRHCRIAGLVNGIWEDLRRLCEDKDLLSEPFVNPNPRKNLMHGTRTAWWQCCLITYMYLMYFLLAQWRVDAAATASWTHTPHVQSWIGLDLREKGHPWQSLCCRKPWTKPTLNPCRAVAGTLSKMQCSICPIAPTCVYIYGPVSRVPTPPMGLGGGMMPLWWCIYIHTYLPTYLRTYIHTITLPYLTLPYLTFHTYIHTYTDTHTYIHTQTHTHTYIHTYIHTQTHTHTYIHRHTHIHTYIHTYIPTYHHHRPQGGTRRTIPPPQATGGGDQKNHTTTGHRGGGPEEPDDTVHPYPLVGGRGGGQRCTIYIYIYIHTHV